MGLVNSTAGERQKARHNKRPASLASPWKAARAYTQNVCLSAQSRAQGDNGTPVAQRSSSASELQHADTEKCDLERHTSHLVSLNNRSSKHTVTGSRAMQHISERSPRLRRSGSSFYGDSMGSLGDGCKSIFNSNFDAQLLEDLHYPRAMLPSGNKNLQVSASAHAKTALKGGAAIQQSNSCSTLYVDQTITHLDREKVLLSIARALRCQLGAVLALQAQGRRLPESDSLLDEQQHPLTGRYVVPPNYATRLPPEQEIYGFLRSFFKAAVLEGEVALVAMVYLSRLQEEAAVVLQPANYKWLVIGCVLTAAKVWDDMAVWVNDFKAVLPLCSLDHFNRLERHILRKLRFNVSVTPREYALHYFDLRLYGTPFEPPTRPTSPRLAKIADELDLEVAADDDMAFSVSESDIVMPESIFKRYASYDELGLLRQTLVR